MAPLLVAPTLLLARDARQVDAINRTAAPICAALICSLAVVGIAHTSHPVRGSWYLVDGVGGVFLGVIGVVGLISALVSPAYLRDHRRARTGALRSRQLYYAGLYVFWTALVAVPLANNLGVAWLVVEATTAASALLVAFSGTRNALEAGWKYLVLTSVGLTVALMGIVMLYTTSIHTSASLSALDWSTLTHEAPHLDRQRDASGVLRDHRRASRQGGVGPRPQLAAGCPQRSAAAGQRTALGGAAAHGGTRSSGDSIWRYGLRSTQRATEAIFVGFGLLSLGVAVPFLWKASGVEAVPGVLEPRAHGCDRARHRLS